MEAGLFDEYRVATPEAVSLAYSLAGIGSRFLAALIDFFIMLAALFALGLGALGLVLFGGSALDSAAFIFFLTTANLVFWGYYVFFETVWEGQSPGKRTQGIRVIKTSGLPIGVLEAFIRNLVRIVDFLPAYYAIGVIVMFVSPRPRRLGDYAAGTVVVRERTPIVLSSLTPKVDRARAGSLKFGSESLSVQALTLDDQARIRVFLDRAPQIRPEFLRPRQAADLATAVAAKIGFGVGSLPGPSIVPLPAHGAGSSSDAEEFLRHVLALCRGEVWAQGQSDLLAPDEKGWDLRALTREHQQVVEEFLARAPDLEAVARRRLGNQIAQQVSGQIGAGDQADPEAFLQRVAALWRAASMNRGNSRGSDW